MDWEQIVDPQILRSLQPNERNRQSIIHKIIMKERNYVGDLDTVESVGLHAPRR
jgi:RHO1 GDP-GTP exchange protein 1/2